MLCGCKSGYSDFSGQILYEVWHPRGFYIIENARIGFSRMGLLCGGGGVILCPANSKTSTVETISLVSLSGPTVYHGWQCIYFWCEVKGSGGGEKWRGSLKVRTDFLWCSGGHPATSPGCAHIDLWTGTCTRRRKKERDRQPKQTDSNRERQNISLKEWGENNLSILLRELLYAGCSEPETLAAAVCSSIVRSLADLTVEAITVMLLQA